MHATADQRFTHTPAGAGEAYAIIGELITFKVTNADTDGTFSVVELLAQPGGGPPLHTHPSSESFTILEGEFEFSGVKAGDPYTIRAKPGDTVFIPGGALHTYTVVGEQRGRTMLVYSPGTEMEQFFAEAGELVAPGDPLPTTPPDFPGMIAIANKCGMNFPPPPSQ